MFRLFGATIITGTIEGNLVPIVAAEGQQFSFAEDVPAQGYGFAWTYQGVFYEISFE